MLVKMHYIRSRVFFGHRPQHKSTTRESDLHACSYQHSMCSQRPSNDELPCPEKKPFVQGAARRVTNTLVDRGIDTSLCVHELVRDAHPMMLSDNRSRQLIQELCSCDRGTLCQTDHMTLCRTVQVCRVQGKFTFTFSVGRIDLLHEARR